MKTFNVFLFSLLLAVLLSACSPSRYVRSADIEPVIQKYAVLMDERVEINSADGAWSMKFGDPVSPPKFVTSRVTQTFTDVVYTGGAGFWMGSGSNSRTISYSGNELLGKNISSDYERTLKSSNLLGQEIDVRLKIQNEKFYGKMIFISANEAIKDSSVRRAWSVTIPRQYVNLAQSGNVAVVYQPAKSLQGREVATWVLWLSKYPL